MKIFNKCIFHTYKVITEISNKKSLVNFGFSPEFWYYRKCKDCDYCETKTYTSNWKKCNEHEMNYIDQK